MRHLTEEEIQAYLDGPGGGLDAELLDHLKTCKECRDGLADYRALYAGLADDAAFEVPQGLAGSVISRLGLKQTRRRLTVPGDFILVACAIVAMLIGVSVFADLSPLLDAVSASAGPILEYAAPHLESARGGFMNANHTLTILVAGTAVFVIMWALDMIFSRRSPLAVRRGR
jgi:anti-sigma factor RsiW